MTVSPALDSSASATRSAEIDAVIFDYGEVLCTRQPAHALAEIRRVAGLDEQMFDRVYWQFRADYDGGRHDGASYWRAIGQESGVELSDEQIKNLIELDSLSWATLEPVMLDWARRLQQNHIKTAILSNMHFDMLRHMKSNFDWLGDFSHLTFSCNLGLLKPDPGIYRDCLEGLKTEPSRTLFLDDRLVNVEGARRFGLRAILFQSTAQLARDLAGIRGLPPLLPAEEEGSAAKES